MNASFIFENRPEGVQLSHSLGVIPIACQSDSVLLSVSDSLRNVLFSEKLWADKNMLVHFYELSSLIEQNLLSTGRAFDTFTLTTPSDSLSLSVLYCERMAVCDDPQAWLSENYLTSLPSRRVAPDSVLPLPLFAEAGESLALTVQATVSLPSGEESACSFSLFENLTATQTGVSQELYISVADVAAKAAEISSGAMLRTFSVSCGHRSLSCFVCPEMKDAGVFYFRNEFNVWDTLCFPALTTASSELELELASVAGSVQAYDRKGSRSFESETAQLSADEAEWADVFLFSNQIVHLFRGRFLPVIITECSCSVADNPEKPNTLSFTWRYTDERPLTMLSLPDGIFSQQFNIPFL